MLAAYYGIPRADADFWQKLAWALAEAHAPGFRLAKRPAKRGRRKRWTVDRQLALRAAVNAAQGRNPRLTVSAACRHLSALPAWKGLSPATLAHEHARFGTFLRRAEQYYKPWPDPLPPWRPTRPGARRWRPRRG